MEIIVDAFLDALIDGVKMLPFLYLAYLLIEWLERNHGERIEKALAGGGHWGFVPGALLGCVPQCGFSAVAANFYASRVITPGTLLAVFLATSDEAIPLLAEQAGPAAGAQNRVWHCSRFGVGCSAAPHPAQRAVWRL